MTQAANLDAMELVTTLSSARAQTTSTTERPLDKSTSDRSMPPPKVRARRGSTGVGDPAGRRSRKLDRQPLDHPRALSKASAEHESSAVSLDPGVAGHAGGRGPRERCEDQNRDRPRASRPRQPGSRDVHAAVRSHPASRSGEGRAGHEASTTPGAVRHGPGVCTTSHRDCRLQRRMPPTGRPSSR